MLSNTAAMGWSARWLLRLVVQLILPVGIVVFGVAHALLADEPPPLDPCVERSFKYRVEEPQVGLDPCQARQYVDMTSGYPVWTTESSSPFESVCWFHIIKELARCHDTLPPCSIAESLRPNELSRSLGYPLNVSLITAPPIGDFLPPGATIKETSLPLVPTNAESASTEWNGLKRPTLFGSVDLVTGLPLVKVTDLELPLDGATFRLNRTRSNMRSAHSRVGPSAFSVEPGGQWWDWTGLGWMTSENPLLLIDSTLPDQVGNGPPTCWLILDAHHSIPFQLVEGSGAAGRYEAPPRFRATMRHNGTRAVQQVTYNEETVSTWYWSIPPTRYEISLYEGRLRYSFMAIRDDVPPNTWNQKYLIDISSPPQPSDWINGSHHNRPFLPNQFHAIDSNSVYVGHDPLESTINPGHGVPYYGLCTSIEDQHGHRVDIFYCDSHRRHFDDASTAAETTNCVECQQDCAAKGQISHISLSTNGSVEWTLFYVYRRFASTNSFHDPLNVEWPFQLYPESDPANSLIYSLWGSIGIDRIYVLPGSLPSELASGRCRVLPHTDSPGLSVDGPDPFALICDELDAAQFADAWTHQVIYRYAHDEAGEPLSPPILVKTTTLDKGLDGTQGAARRERVYHYADFDWMAWEAGPWHTCAVNGPWLSLIWEDEDLSRVVEATAETAQPLSVDDIARWRHEDGGLWNTLGSDAEQKARQHACMSLHAGGDVTWPDGYGSTNLPDASALMTQQFLGVQAERLSNDPDAAINLVTKASIPDETGKHRHFRVHRLVVLPKAVPLSFGSFHTAVPAGYPEPMRSMFCAPFAWQGYTSDSINWDLVEPPALNEPRWIAVIDEFDSAESMTDGVYGDADATLSLKLGQVSRRVVQMNAAGFVIKDKQWDFAGATPVVTGGGLGESYIYTTAGEYFDSEMGTPPTVSNGTPFVVEPTQPDVFAQVRRELLLIERRSVGWSAADQASVGSDQGLVYFYEYELVTGSGITGRDQLQLAAEGIKRGTTVPNQGGGPRLYTRQMFRDPAHPYDIIATVELTEPQTTRLTLNDLAEPGEAPDVGQVVRWFETERVADPEYLENPGKVIGRTAVLPPLRQRYQGEWYFPVEREWFDAQGNLTWSASGLLVHPDDPSQDAADPLASLTLTYYEQDEWGRAKYTVLDAEPGTYAAPSAQSAGGSASVTVPIPPDSSWVRIGSSASESYVTEYWYDQFGVSDVFSPSGRRWARRIIAVNALGANEFPREFVFPDLEWRGQSWHAASPGEIKDYPRTGGGERPFVILGSPMRVQRVLFSSPITTLDFHEGSQPGVDHVFAEIQASIDGYGRIASAELLEPDSTGAMQAVGSKLVNDLIDVYKEQEIDGNIMRMTRSPLGFGLRKYKGTADEAWEGDQALRGTNGYYTLDGNGNPEPADHNMVIAERTEYGSGITNAWLPTIVRRYDRHPAWADQFYQTPTSDPDGFATVLQYDWRMREVRQDVYERGDPTGSSPPARLRTSLTFYDHADRPCMVVSYGPGAPASFDPLIDPVQLIDDALRPTAKQVLQLGVRPLSIVEMHYGPDGSVNETRDYDVNWSGASGQPASPQYQVRRSFYGRGGVEVFSQRPDAPVTVSTLDGVGRIASTSTIAPGVGSSAYSYQLARIDYVYDADGNVVETKHFERTAGAGDALSAVAGTVNAVRSRTVNWYDAQKRLVATADLGTENDRFIASAEVFDRGAAATPSMSVDEQTGPITFSNTGIFGSLAARLTLYRYNKAGQQTHEATMRSSGGSGAFLVTRKDYGNAGRVVGMVENASDANAAKRRSTTYEYQYGRVVRINAHLADPAGNPITQTTQAVYGADILDDQFTLISRDNAMIGAMRLPSPVDGSAMSDNDIIVRYTIDGKIAERIDQRGVSLRYLYDALGRLKETEVGHYLHGDTHPSAWLPWYPESMTALAGVPADRVGYIVNHYDDSQFVAESIAYETRWEIENGEPVVGNPGRLISHNLLQRNRTGELVRDVQEFGREIDEESPTVWYSWSNAWASSDGVRAGNRRLVGIAYPPLEPAGPYRSVTIGYSTSGSISDLISRVETITNDGDPVPSASFEYAGVGRRSGRRLAGGDIIQSFAQPSISGLAGLDTFGRVADLHVLAQAATPGTLYRAEYAHDLLGNRLYAKIKQSDVGPYPKENVRSVLHNFDALNRLVGTDVGALNLSSGTPAIDALSLIRSDRWNLDLLGNAVGVDQHAPGRLIEGDLDNHGSVVAGYPRGVFPAGTNYVPWRNGPSNSSTDTIEFNLQVDGRNQVVQRNDTKDHGAYINSYASFLHDPAGNLTFDGTYYYQYDAWNRLVQVNRGVWATHPDTHEKYVHYGRLVKHYTYDGLGRHVRTVSPYPEPGYTYGRMLRSERFIYDGVRRIQERVTDPLVDLGELKAADYGPADDGIGDGVDPETLPSEEEQGQAAFLPLVRHMAREYVWGPGDGPGGVDELLVQYDQGGNPWWVIQDAGGDVVALCDVNGPGSQPARVVAQWTYDAYGNVQSADHLHAHALVHLGHKGLFVDRLDVGVVNTGSGDELPRMVPFGHHIYHARNRTYHPTLGRWMQADPNAAGLTLLSTPFFHARTAMAAAATFDPSTRMGDGPNLYEYLGSNPWNRSDPMGLSWDPFDLVDDYLAESAGSTAAFLSALGKDAKAAAVLAATIASWLPFPVVGQAGDLALYALGEQTDGELAVALTLGMVPGGKLGKLLGGIGSSAWKAVKHYASRYALPLAKRVGSEAASLVGRATSFLRKSCGCFEAGTEVWTPQGLVPIDQLRVDDEVYALDESTGESSLRRVIRTFVRHGAPIVAVTLMSGSDHVASAEVTAEAVGAPSCLLTDSGRHATLNTTEEHPFLTVEGRWVQAASLQPGDEVRAADGGIAIVTSVQFTGRRTTVYNLEVEGLHNYRVGTSGLIAHNGSPCLVKHHWIPQQDDIRKWVTEKGIDIEKFTQMIPERVHQQMHGNHDRYGNRPQDYLARWRRFMASRPDASPAEIEQFVEHLQGFYEQAIGAAK